MRATYGDRFFYILYFQEVGPPERELEADVERTLRTFLWAASGELAAPPPTELPPARGTGLLEAMTARGPIPDGRPAWLTAADLATFVDQFEASGFFGPISWYRNLDADHALTKDLPAPPMPCAFVAGRLDPVVAHRPGYVESMADLLPDHRGTIMLDGVGHWTQQERPEEFNAALVELLARL
jgi:pimeloyl-ACP methyl ester carboxylesterase